MPVSALRVSGCLMSDTSWWAKIMAMISTTREIAERIGLPPGMKSPRAPQRKTAPFTRAMGYPCPCASHVFEML
jgi:hypothetical protein